MNKISKDRYSLNLHNNNSNLTLLKYHKIMIVFQVVKVVILVVRMKLLRIVKILDLIKLKFIIIFFSNTFRYD